MKSLGKHLIVELYDCDRVRINDVAQVERILVEAVKLSKATIIQPVFHQFSPHGVSGVVVIAESHFTIHTWPEYGYCAVDIFTCGDLIDADLALHFLKEQFEAKNLSVVDIKRGVLDIPSLELKHKP
ncbi:MAG: S-adenosylmethionine decarboxylase proenzyme [Syntrophobacteraceae bacterium CG2_30_61_12]|nr:MAG: S-adenosylmethionine decarboxylase proenzyme [Syntrophobacteraceae bacterium CG2_30_61_12]